MSYDIDLICEHCNNSAFRTDPTYNLTPLFDLALTGEPLPNEDVSEMEVVVFGENTDRPRGLRLLNQRRADASVSILRKALGHLRDPAKRDAFECLAKPNNGWGTHEQAIEVVERLITAAEEHPTLIWRIR